jgi:hypothetical protein
MNAMASATSHCCQDLGFRVGSEVVERKMVAPTSSDTAAGTQAEFPHDGKMVLRNNQRAVTTEEAIGKFVRDFGVMKIPVSLGALVDTGATPPLSNSSADGAGRWIKRFRKLMPPSDPNSFRVL